MTWKDPYLKCFLEACTDEVNKNGRKGSSLHVSSWTKVTQVLKEKLDYDTNQKSMKNCYDYLKEKYSGWLYLTKKTDNVYNPATNDFNLTDDEWKEFSKMQDHSKAAATLRNAPLPHPHLCTALFNGAAATGDGQWTPSSNYPRPRDSSSSFTSPNTQLFQLENICNLEDGEFQNSPTSETGNFMPQSSEKNKQKTSSSEFYEGDRSKKKDKTSSNKTQLEEKMERALDSIIKMNESNDGPSYDECVEKLNGIGLSPNGPRYVAALGIFLEGANYRRG